MKKLFLLFLICCVTGCSTTRTLFKDEPVPVIHPPLPPELVLRDVEWKFFNVQSNAYFALDNENYLNLSKNMVDIAEYIQKIRLVVDVYQTNSLEKASSND